MESVLSKHVLQFSQKSPRIVLGIRRGKCIFCKKDYSKDLFNSKAHAISESLYNKSIFHYNECNDCNNKFNGIEREFSSLIEIDKSLLSMHGKGGVAQTNLSKIENESRITFNKNYKIPILNNANPDGGCLSINKENGDTIIKNIRNTYYNTNIFKCLTKYALSIMPMELIEEYSILTRFVLQGIALPYPMGYYCFTDESLSNNTEESVPVTCSFNSYMFIKKTYFLSVLPFNGLEVKIVKDKNIDGLAIFSIFFGNSAFQIFIPNDDFFYRGAVNQHHGEPLNISFPQFIATEFKCDYDNIEITTIDCSTHKRIEKEVDERHFSSVLVPLNTEKLGLDDKKELVIYALENKFKKSYELMSLWNFKLTLLW
ncbi:TPA: hypothetical protein ACHF2M_003335 [Yersinia enterocolitica]